MYEIAFIQSDEARRNWRSTLNAVERDGVHVSIMRYGESSAVLVPVEWHSDITERMIAAIPEAATVLGADGDDRIFEIRESVLIEAAKRALLGDTPKNEGVRREWHRA